HRGCGSPSVAPFVGAPQSPTSANVDVTRLSLLGVALPSSSGRELPSAGSGGVERKFSGGLRAQNRVLERYPAHGHDPNVGRACRRNETRQRAAQGGEQWRPPTTLSAAVKPTSWPRTRWRS